MARALLPPGFRFHPTDVELVWYYLKRKIMGKNQRFETISVVELYKFAPWDLPEKSCLRSNDLQWHFFCPRDKKYSQGSRTNRATDIGFWKTTGKDRTVIHKDQIVGKKKTLIFHLGKLPQGSRTNWVMYEFRLQSEQLANAGYTQDAFVLCKIFEKSGPGPRNGEQYGAPFKEEDWEDDTDFENANLFCPLPLQSAAPEVGEPSSMLCNFEVGEPSSRRDHSAVDGLSSMQDISEVEEPLAMLERSGIGELSSIQGLSEVAGPYPMLEHLDIGELSSLQGLSEVGGPYSVLEPSGVREGSSVQAAVEFPYVPEPFPDGFSWQRLEAYLDSHLPHSGDAAGEMPESGIMLNDFIQAPSLENENIYSDLQDLCVPPSLEPADAVTPNDMMNYDQWLLHPALAEFAEGEYIRLSDMDFTGEGYPMKYNAVTNDTSLNGAGNIPLSSESQAQLPGPAVSADQLPSTSENDICQGRIRKGKAPP